MTNQPEKCSVADTRHTFALADAHAPDLHADLLNLRKQLAGVDGDLSDVQVAALQEANQKLVLAVLQADHIAEAAVAKLATATDSYQRDPLTGIPNRALGLDRLENAIVTARRHGKRLAVLFFDLDHFKAINDNLGHTIGDQLLQQVAQRVLSVLRDSDTVCRYGGDEFLVLLPDVSEASDVDRVASELLAAFATPIHVGGRMLQPSASLGISLYPDDGDDAATLINRADAAMYRCKRSGKGGFEFYGKQDGEQENDPLHPDQHASSLVSQDTLSASTSPRPQDILEANQQLVMATLAAREAEEKALEAHRQQLQFMAMVAHELRNPLAPLRLATDMLTNPGGGRIPNDRLTQIITSQVTRIARLIDDLLDGSRISSGKLRLDFETVDLVATLEQAVAVCEPMMQARRQHFRVDLPPGPMSLSADPTRLAQIFNNLLDNACKYTPEGGDITFGMTVGDHVVSIYVRDNGLGIAPHLLPTIFELFVQDAHTLPHASGGLGVGLALVRDLVQAHGGTIAAHSPGQNRGSEFVVTLPLT